MRWSQFHTPIFHISVLFLLSLLLFTGCSGETTHGTVQSFDGDLKGFLVEVVVSPLSDEIKDIVQKEKKKLNKKCKNEIGKALGKKNNKVMVSDLKIQNKVMKMPLTLKEKKPDVKVVFTEAADILEPRIECDKNLTPTYIFPISYVLNQEEGLISHVFLTGSGGGNIHGKCREASKGLTSAHQIRQVRL